MTPKKRGGCGPRGCLLIFAGPLVIVGLLGLWLQNVLPEQRSPRDLSRFSTLEISDFSYITARELEAYRNTGSGTAVDISQQALVERFNGNIRLNGLAALNHTTVSALNAYQPGAALTFLGVKEIDDLVAELLAERKGDLHLDGLTSITDSVAQRLGRHKGKMLSLRGLQKVTPRQLQLLKIHTGDLLLPSELPQ